MFEFVKKLIVIPMMLISFSACDEDESTGPQIVEDLSLNFEVTNVSLLGESDGAIVIDVAGGVSPYSYNWSNGETTKDLSNIIAGEYTVEVTDSEDRFLEETITVTEPDTGKLTDIDGNSYKTIRIGNQIWMAENLKVTKNSSGEDVEYCIYADKEENRDKYGLLYTWNSAMDGSTTPGAQGISPDGWHIPTMDEWQELIDLLGGDNVAGGKMKVTGTEYWNSPNTGATNSSGFSALGAGEKEGSRYQFEKQAAVIWSSDNGGSFAEYIVCQNDAASVLKIKWYKTLSYSVRCIKD